MRLEKLPTVNYLKLKYHFMSNYLSSCVSAFQVLKVNQLTTYPKLCMGYIYIEKLRLFYEKWVTWVTWVTFASLSDTYRGNHQFEWLTMSNTKP